MDKILSFIINEYNELLLLQGSPNDPQLKKSIWYVVTGGYENNDKTKENTVKREIKEETGLNTLYIKYLNWIFKYISLGTECIEYVYISFVKKNDIILNEEHIDYCWCNFNDFINKIDWYGDKKKLKKVLKKAINKDLYFECEEIEKFY